MENLGLKLKGFLMLSRLPFLTPGLSPFIAGLLLGWEQYGLRFYSLDAVGLAGITLIMLATYYSNEYFDYEGDVINESFNRFSGGSRALSGGLLPRRVGLISLYGALAAFIALTAIYFTTYFAQRPLLILMALVGIVAGVFYSAPPLRWAYRGVGELWIGFSYGWLATVSAYYIVTGKITLDATLLSLPAAFTVFAVIIINEVPDYMADARVNKRNLVVRLTPARARYLYAAAMILTAASAGVASLELSGLRAAAASALAVSAIAAYPTAKVLEGKVLGDTRGALERICAMTVVVNALAPYLVLAPALLLR
ncbi:prenyltransferase [Acidilobus sp.]|uniref:prenyltransferase n=1 Tax=Acidilobus sp. TaxID=1872109 RepID=UPI003CFDD329